MLTDVTVDLSNINLMPTSEAEEIIQNVRTILLTYVGSVPLDRGFGIDNKIVDEPISVVRSRAVAEITEAINKFEPRAKVKKCYFDGDISGKLRVRIEI